MTRKERRERRARLRQNLKEHLGLDANAELPETHDLRFTRSLVYVILAMIVLMLIWSSQTPVSEIATGQGVIRTDAKIERLEHVAGGQVQSVEVQSGQRVSKGTPILSFKTETLTREVEKLRAALEALELERARIGFVMEGVMPNAAARVSANDSTESLLFWTEQTYLEAQLNLIEENSNSLRANVSILHARKENLLKELELLQQRLERSRRGLVRGALAQNEIERQEREVLQSERAILGLEAEVVALEGALKENKRRAGEVLAQRRREAALRIADVDSQIAAHKLSIEEMDARISQSMVRASIAGTILSLGANRPNEVFAPGELIAEIIPEGSQSHAEIEIPANKIGGLKPGMEVRIKVDTFDFTRFGELTGEVEEISPTSVENEQGVHVYSVRVVFLTNDVDGPKLDGKPLRPGMTVTADILKESKTVLTYLLKPLRLLRDRAFSEA